ncbi:hypothetical protein FJ364_03755, partial [Candidatus Dependentiae bacterium]|nr:hypothetical protein [Candidatus Dependentiae bacterium]
MRYLIKQFYIVLLLVLPAILNTHDPTFSLPSTVRIKSDRQKILSNHEFVFFGHVDFLVSEQLHVFADRMFFDSDINCIRAEAADDGVILLQDGATTILAQRCFIDIKSGEVNLYNACIQGIEGFLAVKYLYRDTHGVWRGDDVSYTPCDAPTPHWQIVAKNVQYDPLLLKLKNINFLINQSVVGWVPVGVVPLRRESHSGFLLPRFMLDYRSGIGVRQDYYWYIHEHADVTTGIDWKNGRGIFGTGEIRWAGNARHNGYFKGYGGYAEHIYVQRKDSIVQTGKPQYWIEGTHSYGIDNFVGADYVSALTMLDNGTDKKIGFEFFDNLEAIDDTFYNGLVIRAYGSDRYFQGKLDTEQTSRKNFSVASANRIFSPEELSQFILENPSDKAVQEFDNRSNISHRPHFFYADL